MRLMQIRGNQPRDQGRLWWPADTVYSNKSAANDPNGMLAGEPIARLGVKKSIF